MKTSILVSSSAALCLLLTFAEAPKHNSAEINNQSLVSKLASIPSNFVYSIPVDNLSASKAEYANASTKAKQVDDFNYLKFDVADYEEYNVATGEVTNENSLDHLKFKVPANTEITSPDALELPVNEYSNVKFDVTQYTDNAQITDFEVSELPANESSNLKFDVTEYAKDAILTDLDAIELPVNEMDYLKFDVIKITSSDDNTSGEISELPVDEDSYLKFDINKYNSQSTLNSDNNFGELPLN